MSDYTPASDRYDRSPEWFRRCGESGIVLPAISLGLWHNFGGPGTDAGGHDSEEAMHENCQAMCFRAFDLGVTHFDLANNYGPPPGSAEERFGRILKDLPREELVISTKAGFRMWPGPYGDHGSRKYLIQSLDQSLRRLGIDHVDIFYHHRPDPRTPLDETMSALESVVRQGKAIYAAISNYPGERTGAAAAAMRARGGPQLLIHQVAYSMLNRGPETDLFPVTHRERMGVICFCPLAQGLLTSKYLDGVPEDSRARSKAGFLREDSIKPELVAKLLKLNAIAEQRGQSLAQMALSWVLRDARVTSALIGASRVQQIEENVAAADAAPFSDDEIDQIDTILAEDG